MSYTNADPDQSWAARALCASDAPDDLFVQGAEQRQVRAKCMNCDVRLECLADALTAEMRFGVWGGLTERERRALLRHYGHITDWWEWINESDDPLAVEIREPRVPHILAKVRP